MPEPLLPPSFTWVAHPLGRLLRCLPLQAVACHAFTVREPELPADGADDRIRLASCLDVDVSHLAALWQVHGADVWQVPERAAGAGSDGTWGAGDALMTRGGHLAVAVKAADCVPILLADPVTGAVAAVHAGWRGTAVGVAQAAVRAMVRAYDVRPSDLRAAIGPAIGPCCYEVGTDVFDRFLEAGWRPDELSEWFMAVAKTPGPNADASPAAVRLAAGPRRPGKLWLDTWQANVDQLVSCGLSTDQIWVSGLCTACHPDTFHSYRASGSSAGRMWAGIKARGWRLEAGG